MSKASRIVVLTIFLILGVIAIQLPAYADGAAGEIDRAVLYINTVSYLILIGTTAILLALLRFLAFLHDVL